jgi:hypothetical protein
MMGLLQILGIWHLGHMVMADMDSVVLLVAVVPLKEYEPRISNGMKFKAELMYSQHTSTLQEGSCLHLTYRLASDKWIPCESRRAAADWIMVHYFTASSHTTGAWTRVPTLLVAARLILPTFRAHNTLWPTCWRAAYEARNT